MQVMRFIYQEAAEERGEGFRSKHESLHPSENPLARGSEENWAPPAATSSSCKNTT